MARWAAYALGLTSLLWVPFANAGNTTCASGQLDWYTSVVGESPCVTYQRLRQICNNDYQVPSFRPNTPGDQCDDQVSACCCNSVAFQLSMLCMNCQQDRQAGDVTGIDAGKGAYGLYRGSCGAGTNHSLPADIQKAVCNQNIRLDDYLYGLWDDGSWFYVWSKENAERQHAANNNNTFTNCPNQISLSDTPTPSSTSTSSSAPVVQQSTANNAPGTISSNSAPIQTSSHNSGLGTTTATSNAAPATTPTGSSQSVAGTTLSSSSSSSSSSFSSSSSGVGAAAPLTTGADSNASSSRSSHSSIGPIVGGVLGGIAVVLAAILAAMICWKKRSTAAATRATLDAPYDFAYSDGPPMGSVTPFAAASIGAASSRYPTFAPNTADGPYAAAQGYGGVADAEEDAYTAIGAGPYTGVAAGSEYWSNGDQSVGRLSADDPIRHDDAGPLTLTRSPSGRLPPAYRSWEHGSDGSRSGPMSVAGTGSQGGSAYSETQPFGVQSSTVISSINLPSPQEAHPALALSSSHEPQTYLRLAPLRRSSIAKD